MRYLREMGDIRGPVQPVLGTAGEDPSRFEARKCSAASRQKRYWELEMGIWSAAARNKNVPKSPSTAMHGIAARNCRD